MEEPGVLVGGERGRCGGFASIRAGEQAAPLAGLVHVVGLHEVGDEGLFGGPLAQARQGLLAIGDVGADRGDDLHRVGGIRDGHQVHVEAPAERLDDLVDPLAAQHSAHQREHLGADHVMVAGCGRGRRSRSLQ